MIERFLLLLTLLTIFCSQSHAGENTFELTWNSQYLDYEDRFDNSEEESERGILPLGGHLSYTYNSTDIVSASPFQQKKSVYFFFRSIFEIEQGQTDFLTDTAIILNH